MDEEAAGDGGNLVNSDWDYARPNEENQSQQDQCIQADFNWVEAGKAIAVTRKSVPVAKAQPWR